MLCWHTNTAFPTLFSRLLALPFTVGLRRRSERGHKSREVVGSTCKTGIQKIGIQLGEEEEAAVKTAPKESNSATTVAHNTL